MCGGCGGQRAADWATAGLNTTRARAAAASAVHQLCQQAGIQVTVSTTPSGFTGRWPTGRTAVTDTLTGLWSAIAKHHHLPRAEPPPPGPGAPPNPVRTPTATATLTVQPGHPRWDGTLTPDHSPIVCSDEPELQRRQHRLDPSPHHIRQHPSSRHPTRIKAPRPETTETRPSRRTTRCAPDRDHRAPVPWRGPFVNPERDTSSARQVTDTGTPSSASFSEHQEHCSERMLTETLKQASM